MICARRAVAGAAALLLAAASGVSASVAAEPSPSDAPTPFVRMEGELVPVLRGVLDAKDALPLAGRELSLASGALRTDDVVTAAAAVEEALAALGEVAAAGIEVLDSYEAEACSADYVAVLRTGFLLLSDVSADVVGSPAAFNQGVDLVLEYGDDIRDGVTC